MGAPVKSPVQSVSALTFRQREQDWDDTPHVRRFDHVGITVADLDAVAEFFVALGLEIEGRTFVEGEFLDTVIGITGSKTEILMLRPHDDGTSLELARLVRPADGPGSQGADAPEHGWSNRAHGGNPRAAA